MFEHYKGTFEKFEIFNKSVLNMPRHEFATMNVMFVKSLAVLIDGISLNDDEEVNDKKLYLLIHQYLLNGYDESIPDYIIGLFDLSLMDTYSIYKYYDEVQGRKFRHLVDVMKMWGLLENAPSPKKVIVNRNVCQEFFMISEDTLESLRTKIIAMDISDNSMFQSLRCIRKISDNGNIYSYKPAINILRYMKEINRLVSQFELSNLLGIVIPEYTSENDLYSNAISIGKQMPENLSDHQKWFFEYMNWKNDDGKLYVYASSQAPSFKFNSFLLFMKDLNLIEERDEGVFALTQYSIDLLNEDIPAEVVELERYINIAETADADKELAELILYNIKPSLLQYAAQNEEFIKAMNRRSLAHPIFNKKGKRVRNRLIAELSKIKANYTCQISKKPTFKDERGNNYVESHHIIEFNGENGPDIIDNLLVISPFYHSWIHHACKEDVHDLYRTIRMNNIITLDTFKNMIDDYNCLDSSHIRILYEKGLITKLEYGELCEYLENN